MNLNESTIAPPEDATPQLRDFIDRTNDARARQNTDLRIYLERQGRTRPWTPTLSCAIPGDLSVSYSLQGGEYRISQRCIKLWGWLTGTPTFTTASGNVLIGGIPRAISNSDTSYQATGALVWQGFTLGAGYTQVNTIASANTQTALRMFASGSGKSFTNVTMAMATSGSAIALRFEIEYRF